MNVQKVSTPEEQGIPTKAILSLVEKLQEQNLPMHSILIARHGCLVAELYYAPYTRDTLHRMFSETKSYTSLAIGLLVEDGKIDLQDKICRYFPEYRIDEPTRWLSEMTVENLLMMETCHSMTTYNKTSVTENWVESFFKTEPSHRPGTVFLYDTSASHTLCALVEKLTGQKMLDYLKERVLRVIGFSKESYVIPDPFGVSMGGTGLMAKPMDMMRVGLMLMNEGKHPDKYHQKDGEQIYPKSYLDKALSFKTSTEKDSKFNQGYGYQFWKLPHNGYAMLGMGSQNLFCFPQEDLVFVCTSDTQGIPNGNDMILYTIETELFGALSDSPLQPDPAARQKLETMANQLTLPIQRSCCARNCQEKINGKNYKLYPNQSGFMGMQVVFQGENQGYLEFENQAGIHRLLFGIGCLKPCIFPEYHQKCVTSAAWCDDDTLSICTWLVDEAVASVAFKIVFSNDDHITVLMKKTEETKFLEYQGILNGEMIQSS